MMKVRIMFKDPDGVYDSVLDEVESNIPDGLEKHEQDTLIESRAEAVFEELKPWLKWKECVTIEFDTEAGTATVLHA